MLRWASWFAVANAVLVLLVGLPYLWRYAPPEPLVGWPYAMLAYLGHLGALAYLPLLVLLAAVTIAFPRPRVVVPLGVLLAAAGLSALVLDVLVFHENRYHLGILTLTLLAPETWAFLALYFLLGLAIEAMLAGWVWRRTARPPTLRIGRYLAVALAVCLLVTNLVHAWGEAHYYAPVTAFARHLPLYFPQTDRGLVWLGLVDRVRARERGVAAALAQTPDRDLSYPLAPLRCEPRRPMPNVLLVVIDAMRADALTPAISPRLAELAENGIRFDAHYSGGNSSRPGMFSLFYGLPASYWEAFANLSRPPVLMELFRAWNYQMGLFSSIPVYRAVGLDRTALAHVPNLRLETVTRYPGSSGSDRAVTEEWFDWLDRRDPTRPFFGFLYYDAAVAVDPPVDYPPVIQIPPGASAQAQRRSRYLTAVNYVDSLLGRVLDDLERRHLLEHTVVIVTSDHGMEFDENGLGFTGHGTAFSEYQLRTPLVIRWPGRSPARVTRRTSHNDLAPTLVTEVFGCANPPSDYSSGASLFSDHQWDWLIAASYGDIALVEPDRVTVVLPSGLEMRDREYRLLPRPALPRHALRAAMQEMSRFYR